MDLRPPTYLPLLKGAKTPQQNVYLITKFIIMAQSKEPVEILRQVDIYSLCKSNQTESKTLCYYIDNGNDVSEYFDEYYALDLAEFSEEDFLIEVSSIFD